MRSVSPARLLREDFAGTCAVAAAWVALDPRHQAVAVELHRPTLRWAWRDVRQQLGERAEDLHLIHGDVMRIGPPRVPRVDIIAALNFSAMIYHDRAALLAYCRACRGRLRPGGVLAIEVFGGAGAKRPGTQRRGVTPIGAPAVAPFAYVWEQRRYDHATSRIDCRIHFDLGRGRIIRDAFIYDWRLWSLAEWRGALRAAGFRTVSVWSQRDDRRGTPEGVFGPVRSVEGRAEWTALVTASR